MDMDTERSRAGYRLHEGFDLSGSDTDYTDTFADMDDAAEIVKEFAKGLMPALWVQDCAGKRRLRGQLDPLARSWDKLVSVDDPLQTLIGCCRMDAGEIVLDVSGITGWMDPKDPYARGASVVGITTNPWAHWGDENMFTAGMTLRLDKARAAWRRKFGGRWRIDAAATREFVSGPMGNAAVTISLDVIPGKDGSLIGCPRSVRGNVSVDGGEPARSVVRNAYAEKSALGTLEGAPEEVSGVFTVNNAELLRRTAGPDGAGWLNHAPARAGCVSVMCSDVKGRPSYVLWERDGRVTVPALTDGVAREWGAGRTWGNWGPVSVDISGTVYDHMTQPMWNVPERIRPAVAPVPAGMTVERGG